MVTTPHIPGLELRIPKGTVLRDRAGRVVTQVSITPIPVDRPPFPLPTGYVPVYFTIQPGGVHLQAMDAASAQGARLFYPNYRNEKPGSEFLFWNYDPMEKGWYVYGQGAVAPDGKQVAPNPGVAIYEFTGAMISPPSIAPAMGPPPNGRPFAGRGVGAGGGDPGTGGAPEPGGDPDPTGDPPPEEPPDPCRKAGDPVNCSTGLFLHSGTDLSLSDVVPISITRTYRPQDTRTRAFGIGTSHRYGMYLVGDTFPYTYQDLVLPDGGRVHFARTSPGTSYSDAVYASSGAPGIFAGAVLQWCSPNCLVPNSAWSITFKNGTRYFFPDTFGNTNSTLGHINGIVDRFGNQITLTHDTVGRLAQITSPNGRWIALAYDSSNRVTSAADLLGRTVAYAYDASGRLASVTDPEGNVESYAYDGSHRMLTVTKPGGQVMVANVYDANGRVVQQTLADGGVYTFAYTLDGSGRVTQTDITYPTSSIRRLEFNSSGYVTRETRALGQPEQGITVVERSMQTNDITALTDALGRRSEYSYDGNGNLTGISRLVGTAQANTTSITYEPSFNKVSSITNPLGHTKLYRYDSRGSRIEVETPKGEIFKYGYDGSGRVTSFTDPLNNTMQFAYDGGDLQTITDPLNRVMTQVSDAAGRLIARTDPLGNTTRAEYDRRDLMTRQVDALGNATNMTYDAKEGLNKPES